MKKLLLIFVLTILTTTIESVAQRVFAPGEDGLLVELKEGDKGKVFLWSRAIYPRKMQDIVTFPLKIYVFSEEEIDPEELYIQQTTVIKQGDVFMRSGAIKTAQTKFMRQNLKKISPNIYEISFDGEAFARIDRDKISEAKIDGNKMAAGSTFVVGYDPNKKSKKSGKKPKFWYANISELPYDLEDVSKWSEEQAIESINQIMEIGKTTEQLFASIKPQQTFQGQQVQYVVVQNTSNNVQQTKKPQINTDIQQPIKKDEIVSDVDKNIPYREINNENTFALIIANEDYSKVMPVNFAKRDGQKINDYLKRTLGVEKDHIAFIENATLNEMRYEINRLSKISDAYNGEASFIIYYIGHGIPDEKNGNGYLLPIDGYGNDVSTAYPLNEFYSQLSRLDARKVILFTDACFSGAGKDGNMLVAARGIAIKSNPNEASGNLIAFSACQGDETAYSYNEKGHGLLTYFFLKKLQESAGKVTLGELEEYIVDNVGKTAIVINGKSQTPSVSVSPTLQASWREQTLCE